MYARRVKSLAAAQLSSERRQREDQAPRLLERVPGLVSLQLEFVEDVAASTTKHRKHVIVARAPALFFVPCGDKTCVGGGHDITEEVMQSLHDGHTRVAGQHVCGGQAGTVPCSGRLRYETSAVFRTTEDG